jgi:hypothetical protein
MKLAHLVSPVPDDERADLAAAQRLTFESMRRARRTAGIEVTLLAAGLDGSAPEGFVAAPLSRSVVDVARFTMPRRLPLLADLVERLRNSGADLAILSNADIAVAENFYARTVELAASGLRAFSINRRTVDGDGALESLLAQEGRPHPGHDCFVFEPSLLDGLDFGTLCLGVPPVGAALVAALASRAEEFRVLDGERITFHRGDDRHWRDTALDDYWQHNRAAARTLVAQLSPSRYSVELERRLAKNSVVDF